MTEQKPEIHVDEIAFREKRHEYGDVYTLIFDPVTPIDFLAGQYVHMRLPTVPSGEKSVREFSFASAPGDSELWFAVNTRSGSPFQTALKALTVGDRVQLFKIKGHMNVVETEGAHLVMLAHGVGIAPFRSILRDLHARNVPVSATLIHVDRENFLYEEELLRLPYEQHRVPREKFDDLLLSAQERYRSAIYYIAGSPAFVGESERKLKDLGIPPENIQTDVFKGLNEE